MKITVGCLLLLATLVQCRFMSGSECGKSQSLRNMDLFMGSIRGMGRIVGGTDTADCSVIPWQAMIRAGNELCGGAIISRNHILTAAHCFMHTNFDASKVVVRVGEHHLRIFGREEKEIGVKRLKAHKLFNQIAKVHDIAILTLKETLQYGRCVAPICLDPNFIPSGQDCIVAGWGLTSPGGQASSVLKMTKLKTYKGSDCQRSFGIPAKDYVKDEQNQMCAGSLHGGRDACQGDSGGALMCWVNDHYVAAGITSYGYQCALPNWPSLITNVPRYYNWIKSNMN